MPLTLLLLAGCGVGLQDTAEPLPSGAVRTGTAAPAPSESPNARETAVCFVNGGKLVKLPESISARTPEAVMAALAAGPPVGGDEGLHTLLMDPLSGQPVLAVARSSPSEVVVRHNPAYLQLSAHDQLLLLGQVVCSMDSIGVQRILLIDQNGQPASAPRQDGVSREGAVTLEDYAGLLSSSSR